MNIGMTKHLKLKKFFEKVKVAFLSVYKWWNKASASSEWKIGSFKLFSRRRKNPIKYAYLFAIEKCVTKNVFSNRKFFGRKNIHSVNFKGRLAGIRLEFSELWVIIYGRIFRTFKNYFKIQNLQEKRFWMKMTKKSLLGRKFWNELNCPPHLNQKLSSL